MKTNRHKKNRNKKVRMQNISRGRKRLMRRLAEDREILEEMRKALQENQD